MKTIKEKKGTFASTSNYPLAHFSLQAYPHKNCGLFSVAPVDAAVSLFVSARQATADQTRLVLHLTPNPRWIFCREVPGRKKKTKIKCSPNGKSSFQGGARKPKPNQRLESITGYSRDFIRITIRICAKSNMRP